MIPLGMLLVSVLIAVSLVGAFVAGFRYGDVLARNQYAASASNVSIAGDYLGAAQKMVADSNETRTLIAEVRAVREGMAQLSSTVDGMDVTQAKILQAIARAGLVRLERRPGGGGAEGGKGEGAASGSDKRQGVGELTV